MADAEVSPVVPPAGSSDPGLISCAPSSNTELGGQELQSAPEQSLDPGLKSQDVAGTEEDEEEAKPRPPLLHLRRDATGRGHRRIGVQNLRATIHITSPAAAPSPIAGASVSGKRTVPLSNEARREMAKQARAVKEERRATLDARHKYLMGRLVDAGTLGEADVEDALISDDKFTLIDDFFAANGSKKLIFFYQNMKQNLSSSHSSSVDVATSAAAQKKLFLTTGSSEPLLGKCLFFLRTTDKAITTANVQQEVNFSTLDCSDGSILNSLETLLSHIMLPALRSQQTWGTVQDGVSCPDVRSFLSSVDQFVSNLSSARVNMERKFQLQQVELPGVISQLSSPADYTSAANNSELVERLEGVASVWTNQIKQVLTESEQMRREADDVGPSAELEHWKRRMVTFNSENYIFGKFDAFCRRLEKIADMTSTLQSLAALQNMKVEGIEKIYVRYQTIVSTTKSKTYDILDHRKLETERMLELLTVFESGPTALLDLKQYYLHLLQRYSRELELLRKTYQRQRDRPPTGRNLPPV
ncbi:LOW QUALITY PROTEIN: dynein axonemal heavy chain 5-like [Scomber scombrus]|uniref:LOW QUALITY PROTEIN: dynein axonemal heavy chain 5-like n=1 Tax=Scomber scombrus TaxID=13677 RepID=A0AAV1QGA2_SCOSC